ncbi:MAG TPA: glycosyltransferase family 4 protein [Spirochaetota bacterium]|nr:glycosyltransferase family 4 protein [Spirochaetota bacterium]
MKKIFIITEIFPPDVSATGQLMEDIASIISKYYETEVITAINDIDNSDRERNYKVKRFNIKRRDKNKKSGRIINGLKFLFLSFFYLLKNSKGDILFFVSNPPYMPVIGLILKLLRRDRIVYLIHDLYPEMAINLGYLKEKSIISKIWRSINYTIFNSSSFVITLGSFMTQNLKNLYPAIRNMNIIDIPNWADKNRIYPIKDKKELKIRNGYENKFIIQYSGNLGLFHNTEIIIEVARLLKLDDIIFIINGKGAKKDFLQKKIIEYDLKNVILKDYVPLSQLNVSLNLADVSFVTLDKRASNLCVPSKFYSIIACGGVILAIMPEDTDIAREIINNKIGFVVSNYDVNEIVKKILIFYNNPNLLEQFSNNSYDLFLKKYEKMIVMEEYKKVFKAVLND